MDSWLTILEAFGGRRICEKDLVSGRKEKEKRERAAVTALMSLSLLIPSTSMASSVISTSSTPLLASTSRSLRQPTGRRSLTLSLPINFRRTRRTNRNFRRQRQVVCMAPEEEKMTRRSPLDFPIEWERPKPGRRPDIFPQFSPMKTPLPPPLPADPPEEDEEEEEKKEEEEEDPEKEDPDQPEKQ